MMRALATARFRLPRPLARLIGDRRGVSAVEFALVAPVMVTLYLGVVEISDAVAIQRKVTLTAAALSNLPAQVTTISSGDMTNILNAAGAIIAPYSSGKLSMSVSCLSFDANKNMTVKWTVLQNAKTPTINVDTALKVASSQLLYAEVSYAYTPIVGNALTGNLTIKDHMYMSPRISAPTYNSTACS